MTATLEAPPGAVAAPARQASERRQDALVLGGLGLLLAVLAALTWRKWGSPEIDPGAELATADMVAHGAMPYRDVRYFYGPLGLGELALAFKVFGTSFTVAFGFGFAQTVAIVGTFYALARHWLRPLMAGLAGAMVLAIAFSGTTFDFVLPHTNSATTGLLAVLLELLALTRRRVGLAGLAAGLACLSRPEFAGVAAAVGLAYLIGTARTDGIRAALAPAVRFVAPAIAVPVVVLGWLAAEVGAHRLFLENLWPVDFIRQAGFRSQSYWMPFDVASVAGLLGRALVYGGLVGAAIAAMTLWRSPRPGRVPRWAQTAAALAAPVLALVVLDGLARAAGAFDGTRASIETESRHLIIGMSWLPALALATAAVAAWRLVKGRPAPFSDSWAVDLALIAAAALLGLRAYNAFTAEGSYAPYYAAPLVLVLAVAHERLGRRLEAARRVAPVAVGAAAAGLAAYALLGLYAHEGGSVHTARGTFVEAAAAAAPLQDLTRRIESTTRPGEPILAAPSDGGIYFMTGRQPALYELMLLPGLLASPADEGAAIARLERTRVRLAVIAARDYGDYGRATFGVDFDRRLGAWLRSHTATATEFGDRSTPAAGTYPSRGFMLLRLRP
jgi:hypothetical protein